MKNSGPCEIRLDRLGIMLPRNESGLPEPNGFRTVTDTFLRPQGAIATYRRVRRLASNNSACKIAMQYEPLVPWLPWARITMNGDDRTGLTLKQTTSVLIDAPNYSIALVEIAFDFHPGTVDETFVLRHGRFGKSRRRKDRGGPDTLRFGTRSGPKLVRCYEKKVIGAYRVELELHRSWLKKNSIVNLADFQRMTKKLYPYHIQFLAFHWERLRACLIRKFGKREGLRIIREGQERSESSLRNACRYFSSTGVPNVHRFLRPLQINRAVRAAITIWARNFSIEEETDSWES